MVADICVRLPAQAVLLSATLPDIPKELPTLVKDFTGRHGPKAKVETVSSLRLPVGCDALDPAGNQVLPHQLAANFEEFQTLVGSLGGDALMQRFYTPPAVRRMSLTVSAHAQLSSTLQFDTIFPHLGAVKHSIIRQYAQQLLSFVSESNLTNVFDALKSAAVIESTADPVPITASTLLTHYCTDGRALAVAASKKGVFTDVLTSGGSSSSVNVAEPKDQTLDVIARLATASYNFPNLRQFVTDYEQQVTNWKNVGASLDNSKVSKRDKEAVITLQDAINSHSQSKPSFNWPLKIHGRSAAMSVDEVKALPDELAAYLLSGVGYYDPYAMSHEDTVSVMKEATEGNLACLFASPFIVYGTNIDLITVFIGTSYSFNATRNALYQLIGRAGRTGKSHRAKVLFQDMPSLRKAMLPSSENIEALIIEHHLKAKSVINLASSVDAL
jgi:hypothetical protein